MGIKLSNAPVYFVIAQAQFDQISLIEDYAPRIQNAFRLNGYPDFEQAEIRLLDFGIPAPQDQTRPMAIKQYSFYNFDRTEVFVLANQSLTFQTTHYEIFENFSAKFKEGLDRINDIIGLQLLVRTGLRYLDAVVPENGNGLSDFIDPHLLGLNQKSIGKLVHAFSETVHTQDEISVTSRAVVMNSKLAIPPDLAPIRLQLAKKFVSIEGLHGVLDIDGSISQRSRFEVNQILDQLAKIHDEVKRTFEAMITPKALETWK